MSRSARRAAALVVVATVCGAGLGVGAAGAGGAGDDPCALLSAAAVEAAVGIAAPGGAGAPSASTAVNQCIYGDPTGLHFRISSASTGDGGKAAKESCKRARAGNPGLTDYAPVKGVGKYACAYTLGTAFATAPSLVVVALYAKSKSVGRILTLAVSGKPEQLAPLEARIDPGLRTLAEEAAAAVKTGTAD